MLQIISGKFFQSKERFDSIGRGVLYSNASVFFDIETSVGKITKISYSSGINTYLLSFQKGLEKPKELSSGVMVATDDADILNQFKYILTFGLKTFFDDNKNNVYINSRTNPIDSNDTLIPSKIIPRFFDSKIDLTEKEIADFIDLFELIILLPRTQYKRLISCLQNFYNALQIVNYNFDLSYTLLIFSLESLSKDETYLPVWEDYNEDKRTELENLFKETDFNKNHTIQIKEILLKDGIFKLQKKFINFITKNITDSFFIDEAKNIKKPIKKLELEKLLKNAYTFRSKHVHELEKLNKNLVHFSKLDSKWETFEFANEKYLTLSGLIRLTHHVITNFIIQNTSIKTEAINYFSEIPNIIMGELHYRHWIWETPIRMEMINNYFTNFCNMSIARLNNNKAEFFDMKNVFKFCIDNIKTATDKQKLAILQMLSLYRELTKTTEYTIFISNNTCILSTKSIYSMTIDLILKNTSNWDATNIIILEDYFLKKYKKNSLMLSGLIEVSLLLEMAAKFIEKKDYYNYKKYMRKAIFELSGEYKIQLEIQICLDNNKIFDYKNILFSEYLKKESIKKLITLLKNRK